MLNCKKCGRPLEPVMVEGVIHCECGTDNKIVDGKVVGTEDDKRSGSWEAPTEKKEPEKYEGRDAEEKTVSEWLKNYRQYFLFKIKDVDAVREEFCKFTGLTLDSVIPRGRFKQLWQEFKASE